MQSSDSPADNATSVSHLDNATCADNHRHPNKPPTTAVQPKVGQRISNQIQDNGSRRLPIWGVTPHEQALYFGLFVLFTIAGILFLLTYDIFISKTPGTIDIIKNLVLRLAIIGSGAAILSSTTVEAPKFIMVAARYLEDWLKRRLERQQERFRDEGRAEGRDQGRDEGRAQERELWLHWRQRSIEAQEQGLPFDQPLPGGGQTDGS